MEKTETFSLITLYFCCVLGLKAHGNSELIEGGSHRSVPKEEIIEMLLEGSLRLLRQ